jgi:hypothetical protein
MKVKIRLVCFAFLFSCAETQRPAVAPAVTAAHPDGASRSVNPGELPAPAMAGWKAGRASPARALATPDGAIKLDPLKTDGDKYTVVLENDRVRVLRYHDKPGDTTHLHHHDDMVMYPLAPFRRRLTFADGTTREREFKSGEALWVPEQMHMGENIGTTDTEVLLVELKAAR